MQAGSRDIALIAVRACKAIKHSPLKRHIDEVGKILYGTDTDMFAIPENGDCPEWRSVKGFSIGAMPISGSETRVESL